MSALKLTLVYRRGIEYAKEHCVQWYARAFPYAPAPYGNRLINCSPVLIPSTVVTQPIRDYVPVAKELMSNVD